MLQSKRLIIRTCLATGFSGGVRGWQRANRFRSGSKEAVKRSTGWWVNSKWADFYNQACEFAMRTLLFLSILCLFCLLASHFQDSEASPSPGHKTTTEEAVVRITSALAF